MSVRKRLRLKYDSTVIPTFIAKAEVISNAVQFAGGLDENDKGQNANIVLIAHAPNMYHMLNSVIHDIWGVEEWGELKIADN